MNNNTDAAKGTAVVLAGGKARRMGGLDKGAVMLNGRRLVDHVLDRLAPQAAQIVIAGPVSYRSDIPHAPDRDDCPDGNEGNEKTPLAGPAAGLWAAAGWLRRYSPDTEGFITAPVDAPLLPLDLAARLLEVDEGRVSAVAVAKGRLQPTFAYWRLDDLDAVFSAGIGNAPSLQAVASAARAREVVFEDAAAFANINTPEELSAFETAFASKG